MLINVRGAILRIFVFIPVLVCAVPNARGEKLRIAVPQAGVNYLAVHVAEARGFFSDEGLESETVLIPASPAIAALLSGNVDYSAAGGTAIRAAMSGAPIKLIMYQTEEVPWYLITDPGIATVPDLKGKKVAVGSIGDTTDRVITTFIQRGGLSAGDITRIALGPSAVGRIQAIKAGSVQAATIDSGGALVAEREGLKIFAYMGDLFPYPFQGYAATDKKIRESPAQLKKFIRAMVRGLMFLKEKPEEATDIGIKKLKLGHIDRPMFLEGVKRYIKALPDGVPGMPSAAGIRNVIDFDVRIPLNIKGEILYEKLFNLKFVDEVKRELSAKSPSR